MLIRLVGAQNRRGCIRKAIKVGMKKGGLLYRDKAKDFAMGTESRQSDLNSEVGR